MGPDSSEPRPTWWWTGAADVTVRPTGPRREVAERLRGPLPAGASQRAPCAPRGPPGERDAAHGPGEGHAARLARLRGARDYALAPSLRARDSWWCSWS